MRFWRRKQRELELDEEIRSHLAIETQQRIERGESPEEARANAYRDFGNVGLVKEVSRGVWRFALLDRLAQDFRHTVRYTWGAFRKEPVPTTVTILTLALVLAAVTIVFAAMRATMFGNRPGAGHTAELVDFVTRGPQGTDLSEHLSYPDYQDFRDRSTALSGVAAYTGFDMARLQFEGHTEGARMAGVTGNYFDVLEVKPWRGRLFSPEDDKDSAEPVAIISYHLWKGRFNASEAIAGSRVLMDGKPFTVVGITPERFLGTDVYREDIWLPLAKHPEADLRKNRAVQTLRAVGRLKSGVSVKAAQASVDVISANLEREHAEDKGRKVRLLNRWFQSSEDEALMESLVVMCLTVLAVACANIAAIGLSRALSRRREIVVRLALGAPRARIAIQTVMESVAVFLPAGLIGAVSAAQMPLLDWIDLPGAPEIDMSPDLRVVLIVLAVTLAAAILAGSTPALDAARTDLSGALKDESNAGGRRRLRLQSLLLVLQVAVSVALLIIGGLYFRSVRYVSLHQGFNPDNLQMAILDFNIDGATNEQRRQLAYALTERVGGLPSVQDATIAEGIPSIGWIWANAKIRRSPYSLPSDAADLTAKANFIGRGYLKALGIPLLKGRDFSPSELAGGRSVAIVSQSLANRLWPGGEAIGKTIYEQCPVGQAHCRPEVIGIAADSAVNTVSEPLLYRPLEQHFASPLVLAYRTTQPDEVSRSLRTILSELNPNVLIVESGSVAAARHLVMLGQYVGVWAAGILGLFAVILTSLGIYGVASYGAQSRIREIGIRTALGARPHAIVQLIIRRSVILTAIGLAIGCIGGLAVVQVIPQDFGFYGIGHFDWPAYTAALLAVFTISFLACYVPSRRAARRDPLAVLRHE